MYNVISQLFNSWDPNDKEAVAVHNNFKADLTNLMFIEIKKPRTPKAILKKDDYLGKLKQALILI